MLHFIRAFTVCKSTCLGIFRIQRVKVHELQPKTLLVEISMDGFANLQKYDCLMSWPIKGD